MLIAILSDTHENIRSVMQAVTILRERRPDIVVHCGDIVSPPLLERLAGFDVRVVYGNNDGERFGLRQKCEELGFQPIDDTIEFECDGRRFFVNHGTNMRVIDKAAASQQYDFVLHGHTHLQRDEAVGRTRIINPGALYSAREYSIAFLEPSTGRLEFVEIPH